MKKLFLTSFRDPIWLPPPSSEEPSPRTRLPEFRSRTSLWSARWCPARWSRGSRSGSWLRGSLAAHQARRQRVGLQDKAQVNNWHVQELLGSVMYANNFGALIIVHLSYIEWTLMSMIKLYCKYLPLSGTWGAGGEIFFITLRPVFNHQERSGLVF